MCSLAAAEAMHTASEFIFAALMLLVLWAIMGINHDPGPPPKR